MIKNYADENGYTLSDYPQSLVDLLNRNKETKEFVLNYPKYKDKHFKINMKEYKIATAFLFLCNGISDGAIKCTATMWPV